MDRLRNLNIVSKLKNLHILQSKAFMVRIIIYAILAIVVFGTALYIYNKSTLRSKDCDRLEHEYPDAPPLAPVPQTGDTYGHALRDYYIKSSYNSCNPGDVKASFVDVCSLKTAIRQGYRFLDFAIYSVGDRAAIASSTSDSYDVKDTYNSVLFADAMTTVRDYAFSAAACPNSSDPVVLHFRVMTAHQPIVADMAKTIASVLGGRTLGKRYSYENDGKNLGAMPLRDFLGKVIICVDRSNQSFMGSPLEEYVNMCSNSVFMRALPFSAVKFSHDTQELTNFNKKNMTIVMPDKKAPIVNPSAALCGQYGCQMVAMAVQKTGPNLTQYNSQFANAGHAFALKPAHLRYTPVTIPVPPPPPASHSYAPRVSSTDYYNFRI
jgi:hypothetical protein